MAITEPLEFSIEQRLERPIEDVFEAIADPVKLSAYFTSTASGPLQPGAEVQWAWPGGESETIRVGEIAPPTRIRFQWPAHTVRTPTSVMIELEAESDGLTRIVIRESGWNADADGLRSSYEHCAGWQHMLSSLRAHLLHSVDLRRWPPEPGARPVLETERLILRTFRLTDAPDSVRICADREVAANTMTIPHPYTIRDARRWLASQEACRHPATFAIILRKSDVMIGSIGLVAQPAHDRAELGYALAKPYWNMGYATEAARAVISYGFGSMGLNRIYASHYGRNPASGRVMVKCGMKPEGVSRGHVKKWGTYEDCVQFAILKSEFESAPRPANNPR
jgi:RimJ/RimL family protein N-acetyltransferase